MQRLSHQAARSGARAAYQPKPKADFKEWVDPDQPGAMAPGMQAHQAALAHAAPAAGYDPDLLRTGRVIDFWDAPAGAR